MGKDEKKLAQYHRLANVALRTLTTVLAVLFAYVLASGQMTSIAKTSVTGISVLMLFGIIFSGISLLCDEKVIPVAKWLAICGFIIMFVTIGVMIVFLSGIMYSTP